MGERNLKIKNFFCYYLSALFNHLELESLMISNTSLASLDSRLICKVCSIYAKNQNHLSAKSTPKDWSLKSIDSFLVITKKIKRGTRYSRYSLPFSLYSKDAWTDSQNPGRTWARIETVGIDPTPFHNSSPESRRVESNCSPPFALDTMEWCVYAKLDDESCIWKRGTNANIPTKLARRRSGEREEGAYQWSRNETKLVELIEEARGRDTCNWPLKYGHLPWGTGVNYLWCFRTASHSNVSARLGTAS